MMSAMTGLHHRATPIGAPSRDFWLEDRSVVHRRISCSRARSTQPRLTLIPTDFSAVRQCRRSRTIGSPP